MVPEPAAQRSATVFQQAFVPEMASLSQQQQSLLAEELYLSIRQKLNALYRSSEEKHGYAELIQKLQQLEKLL